MVEKIFKFLCLASFGLVVVTFITSISVDSAKPTYLSSGVPAEYVTARVETEHIIEPDIDTPQLAFPQYSNIIPEEVLTFDYSSLSFEPVPTVKGIQPYHLTMQSGTFDGPSGKETYYNLDMSGVIAIMRDYGYNEEEYPYWIRNDGAKMFGPYVMVAAELSSRPKGTILDCSLGSAIVVDTGGFADYNPSQLDIAVDW